MVGEETTAVNGKKTGADGVEGKLFPQEDNPAVDQIAQNDGTVPPSGFWMTQQDKMLSNWV